jgi:curli biogenesis system outer membrane secretion channel CsgG
MGIRHAPAALAAALLAVAAGPWSAAHAQGQKVRVAILEFENNTTWRYWQDELGDAAADELTTQLVNSGQFSVVERRQIDAILAEQNLGQSGRVNPATAASIGQILGVQVVLMGSITQFSVNTKRGGIGGIGGSYSEAESMLDVRAINTSTAEIMVVAEGAGKKRFGGLTTGAVRFEQEFDAGLAQEALRPAVESAVQKLVAQAPAFAALKAVAGRASIVGVRDGAVYIDRGESHSVTVGQRFDVYRVVDQIRDSQGNVLDEVTEKVGVIEVTRVLTQSSVCRIVEGDAQEGDQARGQS